MKTILVIDDEAVLRAQLASLLLEAGYGALCAEDGASGLEIARRRLPDLILLCDMNMPILDGHDFLDALRADCSTAAIPLIFLTGSSDPLHLRVSMNMGADDYLTKPFVREDLLGAVAARLHRARQQQQPPLSSFSAVFVSPRPLESLGLTAREAEVLFWMAQSKTNAEIGVLLAMSTETAKKHAQHIFTKLHVENRAAATLRALEILSRAPGASPGPVQNWNATHAGIDGVTCRRWANELISSPVTC